MKSRLRQFLSWLRLVFPPLEVVLTAAAMLMLMNGLCLWVLFEFGAAPPPEAIRIRDACGLVTCLIIGFSRVTRFHPIFRPDYAAWLRLTPWHVGKPLPGGPVHLVPQDALTLVLIWIAMPEFAMNISLLPLLFLVGYLIASIIALYIAGVWPIAYLLAYGMGLVALTAHTPQNGLIVSLLLYVFALLGIHMAWGCGWVPIELNNIDHIFKRAGLYSGSTPEEQDSDLAWPYDQLAPRLPRYSISYRNGVLLSLLFGWWVYVVISLVKLPVDRRGVAMFVMTLVMALPALRALRYINGHRSPLNLPARIVCRLGFIPRYDVIFAAPILGVLIACLGQRAVVQNIAPPEIVAPLTVSLVFLVVLTMGPSFARWHLTGGHRLSTNAFKGDRFEKI